MGKPGRKSMFHGVDKPYRFVMSVTLPLKIAKKVKAIDNKSEYIRDLIISDLNSTDEQNR